MNRHSKQIGRRFALAYLVFAGLVWLADHAAAAPVKRTAPPVSGSGQRVQALVEAIRAKERAQAERILEREALVERESSKRELQKLNVEASVLKDVEATVNGSTDLGDQ